VIERAIDSLGHQASEAATEITLDLGEDVTGLWDEFRIEQVFSNLLANALRHGGSPVQVSGRVRAGESGEPGVEVQVRDFGRGIDPADHERIFGQFERAVDDDGVPGMGLGLYIARQVVESHGGQLAVASERGQGATFTVWLPLQAPACVQAK
jgi:signal transduction histidine kinase